MVENYKEQDSSVHEVKVYLFQREEQNIWHLKGEQVSK